MSDITIRRAAAADAPALGTIHVRAWQAAYRGQMPDAYLDGLSAEERAAGWCRGLSRSRHADPVLVAELDGRVVAFAALGPVDGAPATGELRAINVDPAAWSSGVSRLLAAACEELRRLGHRDALLWVLPGNARARRFYRRAGWATDGATQTTEIFGVTVEEVRYRTRLDAAPEPPADG